MKKILISALLALATAAQAQTSSIVDKLFVYPGLTGAVARTYADKASDTISVKDAGAKCNGTGDDLAAVQKVFTFVQSKGGGYRIAFPAGTCKFSAPIGSYSFSNVEIDLGATVLDFTALSAASTGPLLAVEGTYGATAALTANLPGGSRTVSVNTAGFAADDMVRVYSSAIWDSTRTSTRIGEISFVRTIDSAAQMTLRMDANIGYLTANAATVQKLNPVRNVKITGGRILGPVANDELIGIQLGLCVDCEVRGVRSFDIDKRHIYIVDSVRVNVVSNYLTQSNHTAQAYGVSVADASMDVVVTQNHFTDVRHSLTTNNNVSTSWGVTRRVWFANNTVTDSAVNLTDGAGGDAIDTHAGAEDIYITGNSVYGSSGSGINFEARTGIISHNRIKSVKGAGINVNPRADSASAVTITGNHVNSVGDGVPSDYGINVALTTASGAGYVISSNKVESNETAIRAVGTATYRFERVTVAGNAAQTNVSANGIQVDFTDGAAITGNVVTAPSVGIISTDSANPAITGNSVKLTGSGANGYGIRLSGTTSYGVVSGNAIWQGGTHTASWGVIFAPTVTYSGIFSNVTRGFVTNQSVSTGTGNIAANNL
jgi:hypothetical protein